MLISVATRTVAQAPQDIPEGLLISGYSLMAVNTPSLPYVEVEKINVQVLASFSGEYTDFLRYLAKCESSNDETRINWHDAGSPSYGKYQFKIPTFQQYCVKRYGLPDQIMSGEVQDQCVSKMLEENWGNRNHWKNCSNKYLGIK